MNKLRNFIHTYGNAYFFIGFWLILFVFFTLIPILMAVVISFTNFDGANAPTFIGAANYQKLLTEDPLFWKTMGNTFIAGIGAVISIILALLIAMALNTSIKGVRVYRTIFYAPSICSVIAVSLLWQWMLNDEMGIINLFLKAVGISPIPWLTNETYAMVAMIINGVWGGMGFNMVLYMAALKNIPQQYYEAAELDGAGAWSKFRHITLPGVSPTTFYITVTALIAAIQDFARFQNITGGGPKHATTTIVFYIWQNAFRYNGMMGYAAALSWVLALIILGITIVNFTTSKRWVHYE